MADGNYALINLGDFANTATTFVNRVSDAVGGVFRPIQIKRVAEAEAEAAKITALANIEISDLQRRAMNRALNEEAERQKNIESITLKALPQVTDQAKPEDIDRDWLVDFFDKSRIVSDEEMQEMWSRLLAGEANMPGTYSKRTIHLLASLDKSEARDFATLCNFVWTYGSTKDPLIFDVEEKIYKENGLSFKKLMNLDAIGLIKQDTSLGFAKSYVVNDPLVHYETKSAKFTLNNKDADGRFSIDAGQVFFTTAGEELSRMCTVHEIDGFFEYALNKWKEDGTQVEVA